MQFARTYSNITVCKPRTEGVTASLILIKISVCQTKNCNRFEGSKLFMKVYLKWHVIREFKATFASYTSSDIISYRNHWMS